MRKETRQKVFKYVQSGYLMKLKHCLEVSKKKQDGFNLNFKTGDLHRTPLHIACLLGDDAVMRCLLHFGANASVKDKNGETPLHLAARHVHEHGNYADRKLLIQPIFKKFPDAMKATNRWKETPKDILQAAKLKFKSNQDFEESSLGEEVGSCYKNAEEAERTVNKSWDEKLANEWDDDCADMGFMSKFESNNADDEAVPDFKTFDEWADRIAEEYKRRHLSAAEKYKRRKEINNKRKREEAKDMNERMEKEQEMYRKRMALKKVEVLESRHKSYQEKMVEHKKGSSSEDKKLTFKDIPWPCRGSVKEMAEVIMSGMLPSQNRRKFILKQQLLWHPDKFIQRCHGRLKADDEEVILKTVKALSQELNDLLNNSEESGSL